MTVYRQWFCECNGAPQELGTGPGSEEDDRQQACSRCGATPLADPQLTIRFSDREDYSA